MAVSAPSAPEAAEYTRLHITPLTPALLNTIVPSSILPSARNISYHTIETFPEQAYGFIELPVMDAERIKKKLNGSILKGTKVKIEAARPAKKSGLDKEEKPERVRKEASTKRKRVDETISGVDIGERSVKRGWTTPTAVLGKVDKKDKKDKDKKSFIKSKYTVGKECLFKTILPPNVAAKTKSAKEEKPHKRNGKAGKETIVHEFAKTTKYATFLRGPAGSKRTKAVAEYVEGKGWVDDEGNLVEEVLIKPRKIYEVQKEVPKVTPEDDNVEDASSSEEEQGESDSMMDIDEAPAAISREDSLTSSSGSSSDEEDSTSFEDEETISKVDQDQNQLASPKAISSASSSGTSSEGDSDSSSESASEDGDEEPSPTKTSSSNIRPQSSSGLTIKIPSPVPCTPEVHPLEALYKRPKPDMNAPAESTAAAASFSFSFFGTDANEDLEEETHDLPAPLTPFTKKDFEYRGLRSAAPTPDTAHANKRFIWPTENDDDEDDVEPGSSPIRDIAAKGKAQGVNGKGGEEESDFQKWFWENRGETNRAWKKRRKAVGKEKRQRENRKREGKGV